MIFFIWGDYVHREGIKLWKEKEIFSEHLYKSILTFVVNSTKGKISKEKRVEVSEIQWVTNIIGASNYRAVSIFKYTAGIGD